MRIIKLIAHYTYRYNIKICILLPIIALCFLSCTRTAFVDGITWDFRLSKSELYPGEPVELIFQARATEEVRGAVKVPLLSTEEFHFEILDQAGQPKYQGQRSWHSHRAMPFWPSEASMEKRRLRPGDVLKSALFLNEWFSEPFEPGQYLVHCVLISEEMSLRVDQKVPLRVLPQDGAALSTLLERLFKEAGGRDTSPNEFHLCALIASARSEYAVPYEVQLLNSRRHAMLRWQLLDSLQYSKSLAAAVGIMDFVRVAEKDYSIVNDHYSIPLAIRALYSLRATGKPEILRATEAFVAEHPCPKEPHRPSD